MVLGVSGGEANELFGVKCFRGFHGVGTRVKIYKSWTEGAVW